MAREDILLRMREEVSALLATGSVEAVIGFEEGSLPMRASPCIVTRPGDAGRLTWGAFCSNSLAKYLPRGGRRVGIVARACDTRAIVELVKERQVRREDVVILGVPCRGMADPARITALCGGRVTGCEDRGEVLVVISRTGEASTLALEDVLYHGCRVCARRNPVIADVLLDGPVVETEAGFGDVDSFSALPPDERWERISTEMEKCIRCNACRNACPLCYCSVCFTDSSGPKWIGRGTDPGDVLSFHLLRVMHLAGRCVECGACARACPMGVDLGILCRRVAADVSRLFGCRAGLDEGTPQPLATFDPGDSQEFILEPDRERECR